MRAGTVNRLDEGNNIDIPIAEMTPRNLTSNMAGNLLEGVAVEEVPS